MTDSPEPDLVAAEGPWGGPVYTYRGAEIRCAKGGHVCALFMEGHPLHGQTFGEWWRHGPQGGAGAPHAEVQAEPVVTLP
jgi:hypothetical protein